MEFNINYELIDNKSGNKIFSCFYRPKKEGKLKTIILSHGFMANYQSLAAFSVYFAEKGILAISFDFCGGSTYSRSEGNFLDMSIKTEASDLEDVIYYVKELPYVDSNNIFLFGESLGGVVSLMALKENSFIKGLILLYPDLVIFDDLRDMYKDINNINNPYYLGYKVSKSFITDTYYFDPFINFSKINKKILVFHGTKDTISPIEYSKKLVSLLDNDSSLIEFDEAHGITNEKNMEILLENVIKYIATI